MAEKDTVIIHCSATKPNQDVGVEDIRRWHVDQNGWKAIGYQVIITRDGEIHPGRDLDNDGDVYEEIGAHAAGFNRNSIGVCLIGGLNSRGEPDANFTFKQYSSLMVVVADIETRYGPMHKIGHRDLPGVGKACPCFDVEALFS